MTSFKSIPLAHEKELFFSFFITPMDINLIFSRVLVTVFFSYN